MGSGGDKGVADYIQEELSSLRVLSRNCCIYRAPEHLRQVNEEAYRPLFVSIGPYFYSEQQQDPRLQKMQELKLSYLKRFLLRRPQIGADADADQCNRRLEDYIRFLREKEDQVRENYAENISLRSDEFVRMLLLDAAFIIECFVIINHMESEPDQEMALVIQVTRDFFLQENQLPFFILEGLYEKAFNKAQKSFIDLTLLFIRVSFDPEKPAILPPNKSNTIKHLVDILRLYLLPRYSNNSGIAATAEKSNILGGRVKGFVDIIKRYFVTKNYSLAGKIQADDQEDKDNDGHVPPQTATMLRAAGVRFVASKKCCNKSPDLQFSRGELVLPKISIQDETESYFRSIILLEQCHCDYMFNSDFTNYVAFLESLIDTVEDVQLLVHSRIIENLLGSNEAVVNLFSNIIKHINSRHEPTGFYAELNKSLNQYASAPWHKWKVILKKDYFSHPWSIISVIYAMVLLILTIAQTISGFTQK